MAEERLIAVFDPFAPESYSVILYLQDAPNYKARALIKSPTSNKVETLEEKGAEVMDADFEDKDSLKQGLAGVHGVFLVTCGGPDGEEQQILQGKNAIDAAKEVGVKHFIYSGHENCERTTGIRIPHLDVKSYVEDYLKQSGLTFTIVRLPFLFEDFLTYMPSLKCGPNKFIIEVPFETCPIDGMSVAEVGMIVLEMFNLSEEFGNKILGLSADRRNVYQYVDCLNKHLSPKKFDYRPISFAQFRTTAPEQLVNIFEFYRMSPNRNVHMCRSVCPSLSKFDKFVADNLDLFDDACC